MPQAEFQFLALLELGVQCFREELESSTATPLRLVHRKVRSLDYLLRVFAGTRIGGDADTRRGINLACPHVVLFGKHEHQLLRSRGRVLRLTQVLQADDEFVAAPATREIADTQVLRQPFPDLPQEFVTNVMTQRVVDRLEPVEVDEQDGDGIPATAAAADSLLELAHEKAAIGQQGE